MKAKIIETIENYHKIIIHRHVRPDPDALGSQGGLAYLIKEHYPKKEVYVVGDEEPSLEFIIKMDEISDETFTDALIIICDTANVERISDERYTKGKSIIKIDHHPNEDQYGDLIWVDTNASSVSEMIFELFEEWHSQKGMEMTVHAARCLFAGIVGDTGRFRYPNTTERTFRFVSELVKQPFSPIELYEPMERKSLNDARLQGYILNHFDFLEPGVGAINLTQTLLKEYNVSPSDASRLVNTFANVEGLKAWVCFVEEPDQLIRVRLRSKGPIINGLAQKFNGGGHPLAAGASVHSWDEAQDVLDQLQEICRNA
ncbi:DHH family phosphoesterase [Anaerobacillus isosaccharinicus]|uniref:Bifunctional oligoribonuclease/PAP phosphatase NrnA n=1 Tax=Anaerobacillus isosaccharinicus TaxID=1532552 RepID=A0A1S2LV81_9BACI|nr:bifunctional oligoribonuclease/PAP phosphatase NrnA [Anaerobacillus isosaccharinicus]MBA5587946.1 bifunctional oligoribonuclease/PAP phosphatase NrnA [Anaerobacillus isosaccharinicus]QOY33905.1 bifunctional oligoribonuclease/PAP phosphatase NrnA [Anaerobacillus isosaccharinicus]